MNNVEFYKFKLDIDIPNIYQYNGTVSRVLLLVIQWRSPSIYNPTAPVFADPSDPDYERYQGYYQHELFDYYNPVSILKLNNRKGKEQVTHTFRQG